MFMCMVMIMIMFYMYIESPFSLRRANGRGHVNVSSPHDGCGTTD